MSTKEGATSTENKTQQSDVDLPNLSFGAARVMSQYLDSTESKDKKDEKPAGGNADTKVEPNKQTESKTEAGSSGDDTGTESDSSRDADTRSRKRLEEMSSPELIEELKKNQRISQSRFDEVAKLKKEIENLKGSAEGSKAQGENVDLPGDEKSKQLVGKFEEFKKGITEDFKATWNKMATELGLPKLEHIMPQLTSADPNETSSAKLKAWQDNVLKKDIEKKFNLKEGSFKFVSNDAEEAGTPSYEYRKRTRQKELEIESQTVKAQADEEARFKQIQSKQNEDIEFLAKSYFGSDSQKVKDLLMRIETEVMPKAQDGTLEYEKNPFATRNIIRGYFFDDIVADMKKSLTEQIMKQFASLGMYLPAKDQLELLPSEAQPEKPKIRNAHSPAERDLNRYLN